MDNISPIDGRYQEITSVLSEYFSEFGFFKYRLYVELLYFIALIDLLPELEIIRSPDIKSQVISIWEKFNNEDYLKIKNYETILKHDIKALEYFIKEKFNDIGLKHFETFIHFGITSQDINTSANILALKNGLHYCIIPSIKNIIESLSLFSYNCKDDIMLGYTHGQPAVPTTMRKELLVF